MGCTDGVSDNENWNLELPGVGWGKLFDRTHWPPKRGVPEGTIVRTYPQNMRSLARTQQSRRFRLDSRRVSRAGGWVSWKLTSRGDLSGDIHDSIKPVPDCRIVIVEVVRSSDGR